MYVGYSFPPLFYAKLEYLHKRPKRSPFFFSNLPYLKTVKVFLIYFMKCPSFNTIQNYVPNVAFDSFIKLY